MSKVSIMEDLLSFHSLLHRLASSHPCSLKLAPSLSMLFTLLNTCDLVASGLVSIDFCNVPR